MALYVILVFRTIKEIRLFFMIFAVCILCFGNAIYILNRSRLAENAEAEEEKEPLFDRAFGNDLIDAILNQFMLGVGEFFTDRFED